MATMTFETGSVPQDEAPVTVSPTGDFDPAYPGSTPEAPYGYKANGDAYTRRPRGTGGSNAAKATGTKRMPATETQARAAANLLGRMNMLITFGVQAAGMPMTAESIMTANEQFEQMAYEALLADPGLCRKILGAGATSGKAGLAMAYIMLGVSAFPAARSEIIAARAVRDAERIDDEPLHFPA